MPKIIPLLILIITTAALIGYQSIKPIDGFTDPNRWQGRGVNFIARDGKQLEISPNILEGIVEAVFQFSHPVSIDLVSSDAFLFRMKFQNSAEDDLIIQLWSDETGNRRAEWPLGFQSERMGIDPTRLTAWQNFRLPFRWAKDFNFDPSHITALAIKYRPDSKDNSIFISSPAPFNLIPLPFSMFFDDPRVKNINDSYIGKSKLPVFRLSIQPKFLSRLNDDLPASGRQSVSAKFTDNQNNSHNVRIRYRGDKSIHHEYVKRSWRLEFNSGELFDRSIKKLNLIVPEQLHFGTIVPYIVAADIDLLTPKAYPIRLAVNEIDMGTYVAVEQVDEEFLVRRGKNSGILYSGDVTFDQNLEEIFPLFESTKNWQTKLVGAETQSPSLDPLQNLIEITNLPISRFETEIEKIIDVESYLRWYALYNIFNSMHNDNIHNVKMFFNNNTGKFEMIPWDIDPNNTVLDPLPRNISNNRLSHKLFQIPKFALRRDQIFYQVIQAWFENQRFEDEISKLTSETRDDVINDPFTLPSTASNYNQIIGEMAEKINSRAIDIGKRLANPRFQLCRKNMSDLELTIISNFRFLAGDDILSAEIDIEPAQNWMVEQGIVHRDQLKLNPAKHIVSARKTLVNPITDELIYSPEKIDSLPKCE